MGLEQGRAAATPLNAAASAAVRGCRRMLAVAAACWPCLAAPDARARDNAGTGPHAEARAALQHATATESRAATAAAAAPASPATSSAAEARAATDTAHPQATEPPPADLTEQAKQYYLLGAEAFDARRNADAIRYFRKAARLVPSSKLTYNIALAYDEMGDTAHALAEYRSFVAQEPGSEHQGEVERRIQKLEQELSAAGVQLLTVSSAPAGALLQVGGESVGLTPWSGELPPGVHQLRLTLPGYATRESEVALGAEHATDVHLELVKQPDDAARKRAQSGHIQPLTWSLLGVGAGALTAGTVFELSRAQSSQRADHASSALDAAEARGAAHAKQMTSLVLLGAGAGFVIGGSVLLILDLDRSSPDRFDSAGLSTRNDRATRLDAALDVPCAPEFCGVLAHGRF